MSFTFYLNSHARLQYWQRWIRYLKMHLNDRLSRSYRLYCSRHTNPIQHDVYIWVNYSVSSYSNFIPIFWNVLIWLKYDYMHHLSKHTLTYNLWDPFADTGSWIQRQMRTYEGKYGYLPILALTANNQHWLLTIIGHTKTNMLQQNMW